MINDNRIKNHILKRVWNKHCWKIVFASLAVIATAFVKYKSSNLVILGILLVVTQLILNDFRTTYEELEKVYKTLTFEIIKIFNDKYVLKINDEDDLYFENVDKLKHLYKLESFFNKNPTLVYYKQSSEGDYVYLDLDNVLGGNGSKYDVLSELRQNILNEHNK